MKTFQCECGNTLFFGSTQCVRCRNTVGLCESCQTVTPLSEAEAESCCSNCGLQVVACGNRTEKVCNVWTASATGGNCIFCLSTSVIPDLDEESREKWRLLEAAKRRVLIGVQTAGFAMTDPQGGLPLSFEFKADGDAEGDEPVSTGHANGCITINVREADSVQREISRVRFNEPQRTLVGHFRHELGHYYWQLLVQPHALKEFRQTFGDETNPSYADAQKAYYKKGPKPDWRLSYVSAYATMHPWEDFAETFGAYIDMITILTTATDFEMLPAPNYRDFDTLIRAYGRIGIFANELNRDMGLLDLVPEVFNETVKRKLRFVHNLANTPWTAQPPQ